MTKHVMMYVLFHKEEDNAILHLSRST